MAPAARCGAAIRLPPDAPRCAWTYATAVSADRAGVGASCRQATTTHPAAGGAVEVVAQRSIAARFDAAPADWLPPDTAWHRDGVVARVRRRDRRHRAGARRRRLARKRRRRGRRRGRRRARERGRTPGRRRAVRRMRIRVRGRRHARCRDGALHGSPPAVTGALGFDRPALQRRPPPAPRAVPVRRPPHRAPAAARGGCRSGVPGTHAGAGAGRAGSYRVGRTVLALQRYASRGAARRLAAVHLRGRLHGRRGDRRPVCRVRRRRGDVALVPALFPASGCRATRCAGAPTRRWCGPATSTSSTCPKNPRGGRRASIRAATCSGRAACRWGTSAAPRSSSRRVRRSTCSPAARWPTWCGGRGRCRASWTRTPTCAGTPAATWCAMTTAWWWRTGRRCACGAAWGPTSTCSGAR